MSYVVGLVLGRYDVRVVIETLADVGSVLELRPSFGIVTALVRVAGRPLGLIANNPLHLGGAIDADAADKAARSCNCATRTAAGGLAARHPWVHGRAGRGI